MISCLAKRLQQLDFLQFMCTHLSEEMAKHISIYRKSLKAMTSKNSDEIDLETFFFQEEQNVNHRLGTSHANVCLDENYEKSIFVYKKNLHTIYLFNFIFCYRMA